MPATATAKGILLPCPCCGTSEASVTLSLADMNEFTCQDCDATFSRADVESFIAKWSNLLSWIDAAPAE
jgi:transposase-like protein